MCPLDTWPTGAADFWATPVAQDGAVGCKWMCGLACVPGCICRYTHLRRVVRKAAHIARKVLGPLLVSMGRLLVFGCEG